MRHPIIFTHGYGESDQIWHAQVAALDEAFDVRTWDLPGHGRRAGSLPSECDIDAVAGELQAMIAACPSPPLLVGHSIGGYITLRSALTSPHEPAGLVLISAGPGFRSVRRMAEWNERIDAMTRKLDLPMETGRVIHMKDSVVIDALDRSPLAALVIMGADDREVYRFGCTYIAEHMMNGSLLTVEGAHHSPQQTHPDVVNAAIRSFVDDLTASPSAAATA